VFFVDAGMVRDSAGNAHGLDESTVADLRSSLIRKGVNQGKPRLVRLGRAIAYDDGDPFFSDLRVSVGFGLRIRIPAFGPTPIALDFGFPIRDQSGDDRQILTFSIARDF
jgi:outer membrane protein assembly factor BamA